MVEVVHRPTSNESLLVQIAWKRRAFYVFFVDLHQIGEAEKSKSANTS